MDKPIKRIHLICNAHIDPEWQWEWEEGAAETLSTFRVAARLCREFDDFVFCHNEALLYMWIEEYEPQLFLEIQKLVKEKKWHIMGGWHLQPDCNMPSGEGFVRQSLFGRKYFSEKFNVEPKTAINLDPFGHSRGLVQILAKSGYNSYMFCRPDNNFCPLPADVIRWKGYDGSEIIGCRVNYGYNSGLGHSTDKIKAIANTYPEGSIGVCLWGVGNHGGGPSKIDLEQITKLKEEFKSQNIEIIHSTPEDFVADLDYNKLFVHEGDLNLWAPGCYTSQIRIKQGYRRLENVFFSTERLCSHAAAANLIEYPKELLSEALYDMLTVQFHDSLPGSSIQPVEEMAIRIIDHGHEILTRLRAKAFFALTAGQRTAASDEIPIFVYNPLPYDIETDIECEFMLWDQNWAVEFSNPIVYSGGEKICSQPEKEVGNIPIDWRKRVVFHAQLKPMQINRFDCKMEKLPSKPIPVVPSSTSHFIVKTDKIEIQINKLTGLCDKYISGGKNMFASGSLSLNVYQDNVDPWGMNDKGWLNKIGEFKLLCDEQGSAFSNVRNIIPSVRVIEDGSVRTVIEAVFGYMSSKAVVRYKISKNTSELDVEIRVLWAEKSKMLKLEVLPAMEIKECLGQVAYGVESLPMTGRENVSQKYIILKGSENSIAVINDGVYGSSAFDNKLYVTMLRSPAYTAHPIGDRDILPQDRFSPYIEQGERLYNFKFDAGDTENIMDFTERLAYIFNERPFALSFFPSGSDDKDIPKPLVYLNNDTTIIMTVFKRTELEDGWIVRFFNPSNETASAEFTSPMLDINFSVTVLSYEIKTLKISDDKKISECDLIER